MHDALFLHKFKEVDKLREINLCNILSDLPFAPLDQLIQSSIWCVLEHEVQVLVVLQGK